MSGRSPLALALCLLIADGLLALHLGEFLSLPVAGLLLAAVLASLASGWWQRRLRVTHALDQLLVIGAAAASTLDLVYLAPTLLDGLVRLLLFLVLYKLFTLRSARDARVVAFLGFFMVVIAAASAFGVGFLFAFVGFVSLGVWVLILAHATAAAEADPRRVVVGAGGGLRSPTAFLGLALGAAAGTILITAILFFVIPRVGLAALPFRARVAAMVTGFGERVELGSYGEIETDATVVMRVHFPDWVPEPERLPRLRWRGIVFDDFDGTAWTVRQPRRLVSRESLSGDFWLSPPTGTSRVVRQEIFLEPIGTDVIFAAPRALWLKLRSHTINVDDMGSVSVPAATARLSYLVESEIEPDPATSPSGPPGSLEPEARARYLRLPPLPARISGLARQVAAGSRDTREAALRLTAFLSQEYRYTLALTRQTSLGPVDEFLFVSRAGNCEYFAASLAVMLRGLGIPARVVGGFQRGEWNPYGRYFMVRLQDAHAWVEAYLDGAGWVTLDPSPRAAAPVAFSSTALYLDALRMRWARYVVNWSLRDQLAAATAVRRGAQGWAPWVRSVREWRPEGIPATVAVASVVVAAGVAFLLLRGRRSRSGSRPGHLGEAPRFYRRALRRVRRRGLRPEAGETAREFAVRAGLVMPAWTAPLGRVTAAYERCRFGGAALTPAEEADLEHALAELSARTPGRRPAGVT